MTSSHSAPGPRTQQQPTPVARRHPWQPTRAGRPIRRAIAEQFVLPVDLLIRSYETFAEYRPDPNSMLSRMLEDSEVLYDRRTA